jgi:hypothetical protein
LIYINAPMSCIGWVIGSVEEKDLCPRGRSELTDAEEYRQVIPPARAAYVVTGRGRFIASIIRINLHHLWMQRLQENLPRVWCIET